MKVVNLTPHPVHLVDGQGVVFATIPVAGKPARCAVRRAVLEYIEHEGHSIAVAKSAFGAIEGLPAPAEETLYVVSMLVAQAAAVSGRSDVVYPDDVVRDSQGAIVGCRGFAKA